MNYPPDGQSAVKPAAIAFLFQVLIDGKPEGDFSAVEGISLRVEPYSYQEGGKNDGAHVLPGQGTVGEVTLRWGIMHRDTLLTWAASVNAGKGFRRNVQVLMLTRSGDVHRSYTLEGAWPLEWKASTMDSGDSRIPVEELRLSVRNVQTEIHADA